MIKFSQSKCIVHLEKLLPEQLCRELMKRRKNISERGFFPICVDIFISKRLYNFCLCVLLATEKAAVTTCFGVFAGITG